MPTISIEDAKGILQKWYDINGRIEKLPGETDHNFKVTSSNGCQYILKIHHTDTKEVSIEAQNEILSHLADRLSSGFSLPKVYPNREGSLITTFKSASNATHLVRLLSWVEGRLWAGVIPHTSGLLKDLGRFMGKLCIAMQDFAHPAAHRTLKWDASNATWTGEQLHHVAGGEKRTLASRFHAVFMEDAVPQLSRLRKSVIHNDANDYNIVVADELMSPSVKGIIDFGDFIYGPTVQELAVAIAYAVMHKPDPLTAAAHVVRGMHEVFPLADEELEVLYYLVGSRLLISVTCAAINMQVHAENKYLQVSAQPAWDLLEKWSRLSPAFTHYTFRHACGKEPCPKVVTFRKALSGFRPGGLRHMFPGIDLPAVLLDLSVGSLDLGNNENFLSIRIFEETVNRMLESAGKKTGIGGYGEVRPFYTSDAYQVMGNEGPQWRTIHLGLDVWAPAGTPVCTPVDGVVFSAAINEGERNYGPTIILAHEIPTEDGPFTFYTLYGHLSCSSLDGWEEGRKVKSGEKIATIGPPPENGNWPPHLHFQVMLDMLSNQKDFPGVAYPEQREVWLSICPNPLSLIDPAYESGSQGKAKDTSETQEILDARRRFLGSNLSVSYKKPLHMVRGYGQYLYDDTARRYLDTVNNVAHVGHSHPSVVKAANRQHAVLNTNTRYLHKNLVRYAEELLATFPGPLEVVFFVNSGSEANELALRLARTYTGRQHFIVMEGGYHGNTGACVDISSYKFDGPGGKGAPPFVHTVPLPDPLRGLYHQEENPGKDYAARVYDRIREVNQKASSASKRTAGFISESILSCGGQIVLPDGFLKEAYRHVRSDGGLCIADEVQTGLGRTGRFWAFEWQDVVPDIVTVGKPIGNGHPLGAVVTTRAIADAFANGMEFFNTFGGNPVSCAIGLEVLRIVQGEGLMEKAEDTGRYLMGGLLELSREFPVVADVRGQGLFLGYELITPSADDPFCPAAEQAIYLTNRLRELGILASTDGPLHNVIKIKPPMVFTRNNADFLLEMTEKVVKEIENSISGYL